MITYYWPPAGGPGVHRWLRFSKYFEENNCQLHVYSPQEAAWPITDEDLKKQVSEDLIEIRRPIFEPHKYLGKKNNPNIGGGLTQTGKGSPLQKFIIWVRGNLFIPDARVFWIKPSYRYLKHYLQQHPEITTVISTGPPHSLHVIALKLKRNLKIKWIADFRDPWTDIDFYDDLKVGKWADQRQKKLEKACLQEADEVITVSKSCAEGLKNIVNRSIHVVTNGYDFPEFNQADYPLDEKFSIAHFGSMPNSRNPEVVWRALHELCTENNELKSALAIRLVGAVDFSVFDSIEKYGLSEWLEHISMLTHAESIAWQRRAQILLLVANNTGNVKGILTGKFFEYLGSKRPVLAVGQSGSDLEEAVNLTDCGAFVDFDELQKAKKYLSQCFEDYQKANLQVTPKGLENYTSANLAKKIVDLC